MLDAYHTDAARGRWRAPVLLFVGCGVIAVALLWPLRDSERFLLDAHYRWRGPHLVDSQIMLVTADDLSLRALGPPPWSAETYAHLLTTILAGDPKLVVWMLPMGPDAEAGMVEAIEADLSRTLRSTLYLPALLEDHPYDVSRSSITARHPGLEAHAVTSAVTHVATHGDGVARFAYLGYEAGGDSGAMLETVVAARLGAEPTRAPTDADGRFLVGYAGPPGTFPRVPLAHLLDGQLDPSLLRGKIAIVAPAATAIERQVMTPTSGREPMPVAEVFANVLNTHLEARYVWQPSRATLAAAAALYGVFAGVLFLRLEAARAAVAALALLVGALVSAHLCFVYADIWLDTRPTLAATTFALVCAVAVDYRRLIATSSEAARELSEGSPGLHRHSQAADSDEAVWRELAQAASMFLDVEGVAFLERETDTDRLTLTYRHPEGGDSPYVETRYSLTHRHIAHVAQGSPALVQGFVSNAGVDTYLVPLMSFGRLVAVLALSRQTARAYFEERRESIVHLGDQMTAELTRRGTTRHARARSSTVARLSSLFVRRATGPDLPKLAHSIVEERQRVETVMNNLGDGVAFYDLLGRSVLYNDQALDMAAQLEGDADIRLLHDVMYAVVATASPDQGAEASRGLAHEMIENLLVRGRNTSFLVEVGGERKRYYQVALTAVRRADGAGVVGIACVLSDVSIYEQITEYKDVMGAIESRGRNYLTPILGYGPILLGTDLTEQQRQMMDAIHRNAVDLAATLDEFRNHTELHTGPAGAHNAAAGRAPIDLMEMARDVAAWKRQDDVNVVVIHQDELVERVWGVRSLVEAVIARLVDMLWEHLPPESEVRLRVEWTTAGSVSVEVYEEGYGVPQDALDAAISELSDDSAEPVEVGPSDLGSLTLRQIRHIVTDMHAGEITCESHLGRGMKFSMSFRTVL